MLEEEERLQLYWTGSDQPTQQGGSWRGDNTLRGCIWVERTKEECELVRVGSGGKERGDESWRKKKKTAW